MMGIEQIITKAQTSLLVTLRDDTRFDNRKASVMNRTALALEKLGLVEWKPGRWFGGRWEPTPAGRAALSEAQP